MILTHLHQLVALLPVIGALGMDAPYLSQAPVRYDNTGPASEFPLAQPDAKPDRTSHMQYKLFLMDPAF